MFEFKSLPIRSPSQLLIIWASLQEISFRFVEHCRAVLGRPVLQYREDEDADCSDPKASEVGRFSLTVLLSFLSKYFRLASLRKRGLYRLLVRQLFGRYVALFIDLFKLSPVLGVAVRGL
jgi:hypothetical protein